MEDIKYIFNFLWMMLKGYHGKHINDATWELIVKNGKNLCRKYENAPKSTQKFCIGLFNLITEYFADWERENKG